MADPGIGIGIGRGLSGIAEGIRQRGQYQYADREKQADKLVEQMHAIRDNIAQVGLNSPEGQTLSTQLKDVIEKHNALYPAHETPALMARIQKMFGKTPAAPQADRRAGVTMESEMATAKPNATMESMNAIHRQIDAAYPNASPAEKAQHFTAAMNKQLGIAPTTSDWKETGAPFPVSANEAQGRRPGVYQQLTRTKDGKVQSATELRPGIPPSAVSPDTTPKTPFAVWREQNANAPIEDWFKVEQSAKPEPRKSAKERITELLADAFESGNQTEMARLQTELRAIDPQGEERLRNAAEHLGLAQAAAEAKAEAVKEKRIAPLRGIVNGLATARQAKLMGDAGNAAADVDLTLAFFRIVRGPQEGAGIRFTDAERKMILDARPFSESLQVLGNKVTANGQPLSKEQRQRMLDTIEMHASAAQKEMDAITGGTAAPTSDPVDDVVNELQKLK